MSLEDFRVRVASCWSLLLGSAFLALAPARGHAVEPEVDAAWKRHEIEFTYMGFTTRYSCEGLRDKVRLLMSASGARPDFEVSTRSCASRPGQVADFPRVRVIFHAPEIPATGSRVAGDPTPARWRRVLLGRHQPQDLEAGDCELVEQFEDRVLNAFTTRNVASDINCIPHQLAGSSFRLEYEVLVGLHPAAGPNPAR
jgi:hypothetical protein